MATSVIVRHLPDCDFCGKPAKYDAKTRLGPWANMCAMCWRTKAMYKSLGTGLGQRLVEGIKSVDKPNWTGRVGTNVPGDQRHTEKMQGAE